MGEHKHNEKALKYSVKKVPDRGLRMQAFGVTWKLLLLVIVTFGMTENDPSLWDWMTMLLISLGWQTLIRYQKSNYLRKIGGTLVLLLIYLAMIAW